MGVKGGVASHAKSPRVEAKPFLKWAGGKQQLLTQLEQYLPAHFTRYIEPFVGGGAVFFHLWHTGRLPEQVILADTNAELINTYHVVRDHLAELLDVLARHKQNHSREYYYQIRSLDRQPEALTAIERAARMIYLNKTCYNGLYRVNRKGQFNVPLGSYRQPQILYSEALTAASAALQQVDLQIRDFHTWSAIGRAGDFFYFDPPYHPLSKTANFTSYTAGAFRAEDQGKLADVFTKLTAQGCLCMLSNSATPLISELYGPFQLQTVLANRAINSDANGRKRIPEVVVMNYTNTGTENNCS
jgi:DNA adenine methylase